jgi:hypothetical protein
MSTVEHVGSAAAVSGILDNIFTVDPWGVV